MTNDTPEWKQKALALWPDLQDDLDDDDTIYTVFFELRARCHEAHSAGDTQQLAKIYGYAEWCLYQEEKDIWNAAGVSFYEHLGDEPKTREGIPTWVMPNVYEQVSGLLHQWMGADEFAPLDCAYRAAHPAWSIADLARQEEQERRAREAVRLSQSTEYLPSYDI